MQAIILAAGMGKRLKELTQNCTKCMVKVNGTTLIERMLRQIVKQGVSRIIIVVGYEGKRLIEFIETLNVEVPIVFIENPIYDKTNNIYSLSLVKDRLCEEDTLLFESDLIFEDSVLDALVTDSRKTLALVAKYESWMDGTCVKLSDDDDIEEFVSGNKFDYKERDEYFKTVNIYKFSKDFSINFYVPFLKAYQSALGENEYYEQVLRVITMLGSPIIKAKRLTTEKWYEIDDIQDLDIAESIFIENEKQKIDKISSRYGGYWRYPHMLDFCYLVNPFFPTVRMKNEMRASFDILLTQYPSGMSVNSLLAGKNFGVHQENIVVGNGAAEIINHLLKQFKGRMGIIKPTFEEYANRYKKNQLVVYSPNNEEFKYTAKDLIYFFSDKKIENLIIINPDNPSGNYISRKEMLQLVEWAKLNNVNMVLDESFVDFSEEENPSLLSQDILEDNPNLYIIKSISKSYGVPGLRLGVLASGNVDLVSSIKKDISIWNVNSFAEFYMQIAEKYKKDYEMALCKFKAERGRYINALSKIDGIRVIPSQANYLMIEITNGLGAKEVCQRLLNNHQILVKNLDEKMSMFEKCEYIRLAVRNSYDNDVLVDALRQELMEQ